MQRTEFTYGQLDKLLRSLGFSCRVDPSEPPTRVYEHKQSGARVFLPTFPEDERVLEYHLVGVRTTLDGFNIVDATAFAKKLQKAS
ncbi:MAG TPA: hypothetical protein VG099_08195 [Gemmataceae bacterium]|jgi:hypothetical protein|nr:hypothetical protein [Gemmataceae bacterium]